MDNYFTDLPLELFVTTSSSYSVTVNVTSPRWYEPFVNETFTISTGQVRRLTIDVRLRLEECEFSSKAILIQASHEVVVYGVNKQKYSNDAFLALPTDVLGTEYFTVTYYPPHRKAQIMIVAVENETQVEIFLTANTKLNEREYSKGETFSKIMQRYDTLQLQSDGDFTGCRIQSRKRLAVFSGNIKTSTGLGRSQDHLVEHLTPVELWGKKFATIPIPERTTGDLFKIIASIKTTIKFHCKINTINNVFTVTLEIAGDFYERVMDSDAYCYIESTEAILVVQIVLSQISSNEPSDPSMIIIPPIEQYSADYTFSTPDYSLGSYDNFFMFIVKESEVGGLRIDEHRYPNDTKYNKIPGTSLVGGYISVSNGFHKVAHESPISVFCGILYGRANWETYGFPIGMRMAKINTVSFSIHNITFIGLCIA